MATMGFHTGGEGIRFDCASCQFGVHLRMKSSVGKGSDTRDRALRVEPVMASRSAGHDLHSGRAARCVAKT
eukprot:9088293-Pyramimonas_sp.AAC.1